MRKIERTINGIDINRQERNRDKQINMHYFEYVLVDLQAHTHTQSLTHIHAHCFFLTHTHTLSHTLSRTHRQTHTFSLYHKHKVAYTHNE